MVVGDTVSKVYDLEEIKRNNIKNIFLNNILVENENGIINYDDADNYADVLSLIGYFLKNTLTTEISYETMNYTLDGNNFIKYINSEDEDLRNENNFYLTNLASNNLKKYVFLCDVMADYYETNEINIDNSEYYIHKLKFNCGQYSDDYCSDILILNNANIIKYKYSNNVLNIVEEPNSNSQNSKTFKYLFEDIIINRDNNKFDKKVYGKYHYKYKKNEFKFYSALINYNILLAYYYYINKQHTASIPTSAQLNQEVKNKITNQIKDKIILFKNLFQYYENVLLKTKEIRDQSNVRNDLSESEKISNFNQINQELIQINNKIEYKKDKDMMFKDNININIKDKIKTITIFVYYTIITFFLLNVILFNYYSEETNKFLSIIITIFLIFVYFVLKLFKNDYYEFFDEETGGVPGGETGGVPGGEDESNPGYITGYISNGDMYDLLASDLSTLELFNIDITQINDTAETEDMALTGIRNFFGTFNCDEQSATNCPETSIQAMFESLDSNSTDGNLLASISDSAAKLQQLITDVGNIKAEITSIQGKINEYSGDNGFISKLETSLTQASQNNRELRELNEQLMGLNSDLTTKNSLIKEEIEKLKSNIEDIMKKITINTGILSGKINDRDRERGREQELQFTVDRLKRQTEELFKINNALDQSFLIIEASNQKLNVNIVNSLDELLDFRKEFNEKSKEIADWYDSKEAGDLLEQQESQRIIAQYEGIKKNLQDETQEIDRIKNDNGILLQKLETKITNLTKIQNKKTYVYNGKFINIIDYDVDGEEPYLKFRNEMEKDISNLLDIYQSRIIIDNENYDGVYITFDLKILPSPSYLKLEEHIKKMHDLKLILDSLLIDDMPSTTTFQKERKNNLLKTTYAKYIVFLQLDRNLSAIGLDDSPQFIISKGDPDVYQELNDKLLDYTDIDSEQNLDKLKRIIKNNNTGIISNIIKEIEQILKNINSSLVIKQEESPNYKTYYDEVHPNLQKELIKYQNIDNNNTLYDHIIESKLNTTEHDLLYLNALNKFFIHLSLYLGIFYIYASHFNYFGYTINFFITIIVLLILLYYLFKNIHKKVRRDSSKSYWKYSKNYFDE